MERKRHLPRRILRSALAYMILNAGIFGWIQVSAASANKLQPTETVMAQVRQETENTLKIAVLGNALTMDLSLIRLKEVQALTYACTDPVLLAIAAVIEEYDPI